MNIQESRRAFGARVRALREGQNISLRRFALMIDRNKDYMVAIEYGRKSPSLSTIMKIARGLDVTPGELFAGICDAGEDEVQQARQGVRVD